MPELAAGLQPRLPFAGAILVQDTITACLGAFAGGDGAVAILGTGTAYVAKSGRAFHHVGGWGFTLGDEGSAARLGRSALVHALKAHDGTEPRGVLADLALARFGTPARIVAFAATAPPRDFGALAPLLFAAIEAGDPAAKAILAGAIIDIEAALDAILAMGSNRLCLMGGLADRYAVLLAERFGSRLVAPAADAMEGALLIARDASLVGGPGG